MIRLAFLLVLAAGAALAQGAVNVVGAVAEDNRNGATLSLTLTGITPYRVFTLDDPRRLVLDVEGLALEGFAPEDLADAEAVTGVRAGPFRPGWARMIFDLSGPFDLATAGMVRGGDGAVLTLTLTEVSAEAFAANAGAPPDPDWEAATGFDPAEARRLADSSDFVIVLDPAHGGIDAGVTAGGIRESDLALIVAQELAVRLNGFDGIKAVLARRGDDFVPTAARLQLVRDVGAGLLVTFHADADGPRGLRVATFEDGATLLSSHTDAEVETANAVDAVTAVLDDLARAGTGPASDRIADAMVAGLGRSGAPLPREPRVTADDAMLGLADVPAVAILLGNLADPEDRAFLASPAGRDVIALAIADIVVLLAR